MASKASVNPDQAVMDQLDAQGARGWKPDEGDTIVGSIQKISASTPSKYGIYPIVLVMTEDGELVNLHCFHNVLRNRLLEQRPKVGERIAVKYVGREQGKNFDEPYYSYSVVMPDRPVTDDSTSWDIFETNPDGTADTE